MDISPEDRERPAVRAITENLASLNEIMAEMVAAVSPDPEFVAMTRDVLRDHSFRLGYEFQGEKGEP